MSNNNGDLMENRIIKRDEKCPLITEKIEKKIRKTKAENASLCFTNYQAENLTDLTKKLQKGKIKLLRNY